LTYFLCGRGALIFNTSDNQSSYAFIGTSLQDYAKTKPIFTKFSGRLGHGRNH